MGFPTLESMPRLLKSNVRPIETKSARQSIIRFEEAMPRTKLPDHLKLALRRWAPNEVLQCMHHKLWWHPRTSSNMPRNSQSRCKLGVMMYVITLAIGKEVNEKVRCIRWWLASTDVEVTIFSQPK